MMQHLDTLVTLARWLLSTKYYGGPHTPPPPHTHTHTHTNICFITLYIGWVDWAPGKMGTLSVVMPELGL